MVRVWCPLVLWNRVQSLRVKAGGGGFFVVVCWVWWCAGGLVVGKGIFEHPLILTGLFAIRYCEVNITIFITVGTGLFVNTFWYAGGGVGTGRRTILLIFLFIITAQAAFEYVGARKEDRPRIWTPLTVVLLMFWLYHMAHVLYIYLFLYDVPRSDDVMRYIGISTLGIIRYFDGYILWIGILPLIILLRD
jgi:hypothetical protein